MLTKTDCYIFFFGRTLKGCAVTLHNYLLHITHREFRILVLRLLGACGLDVLRHLGKGEAKLDVTLQFSGMKPTTPFCRGVGELEKPEFDCALREGRMVIEAMVPAGVVMLISAVVGVVPFVPDVR